MLIPEHYTEEELRQWGRAENARRMRELSEDPSYAMQRAALRRNYASLTVGQAAWAIGQAQKEMNMGTVWLGKASEPSELADEIEAAASSVLRLPHVERRS